MLIFRSENYIDVILQVRSSQTRGQLPDIKNDTFLLQEGCFNQRNHQGLRCREIHEIPLLERQ